MRVKGLDRLRDRLPNYQGVRIALLPLGGLLVSFLAYGLLVLVDILPRVFPESALLAAVEPVLPLVGSCVIAFLALRLIASLWIKREPMKREYGNLAYQHMIPYGVAGVFLVPSLVYHAFTSVRSLPPIPPVNGLTVLFSQSVLPLFGIMSEIDVIFRIIASGMLLVLGVLTVRSAIMTFGIDYMTVVYLYFPEESEIQNHEIYSVIRHPAYFAVVLFGAAGLTARMSVYSILIFLVIFVLLKLHIRREEGELIERFGSSYAEYRRKVPGLHLRMKDIPTYLRFLLLRMNEEE